MRSCLLATLLLPVVALGDAGILGSVVRGPSVLSDSGPDVRMLAQDVLISVDRHSYEITGCFLLHSPSDEGTVFMYFPVDIITPFVGMLYSSTKPDALLERVDVTVDGIEAEVFPMFVCEWGTSKEPSLSCWESAREMTRPLLPDEPDPGEPFYATRIPPQGEVTGSFGTWLTTLPGIRSQALNAAWSAGFGEDDTVLVEYHVTGRMTTDYDSTMSILCYPLQTGSTWTGSIGSGRVTVVPSGPAGPGEVTFIAGSMLPESVALSPGAFEPLPEMAGHHSFAATRLSRLAGTRLGGGFQWSFSDFEPSAVPEGWRGLFPGLGDMYAVIADSVREWRTSESAPRPTGWGGSFIYAFLSDDPPDRLTVIDLDGVQLHDSPDSDAPAISLLPVNTVLDVIETRGPWILVDCSPYDIVNYELMGPLHGWIELYRTGDDGLSRPAALPML
ncbi:MAG: hypothetical protein QUS11_00870 [Candidatus Fermentibacter sp.]|nr:hypothetical protein [Candidatus Fermentibacter sp.]